MANFVLVTRGTRGDLAPFLAIGKGLALDGHQVTILTHCLYADAVKSAGLLMEPLDSADECYAFWSDMELLQTPRGVTEFAIKHLLPTTKAEMNTLRELTAPKNSLIVARHATGFGVQMLAELCGLRIVSVFTAISQIPTISVLAGICAATLGDKINYLRKTMGLRPVSDWHAWWCQFRPGLGCWPEWFWPPEWVKPCDVKPIGFLLDENSESGSLDPDLEARIDETGPPIVVTGGSGKWPGVESFYQCAAEACGYVNRPTIMVLAQNRAPADVPNCVKVCGWQPFATLVPLSRLVIHHGGAGTTARSLCAGVPQIAMARGGDRLRNAIRVEELGTGRALQPGKWHREVLAEQIEWVLSDLVLAHSVSEKSLQCQNITSIRDACKFIESCAPLAKGICLAG